MTQPTDLPMAIAIGTFLAIAGALWQAPTLARDIREGNGGMVALLIAGSAVVFATALLMLDYAADWIIGR